MKKSLLIFTLIFSLLCSYTVSGDEYEESDPFADYGYIELCGDDEEFYFEFPEEYTMFPEFNEEFNSIKRKIDNHEITVGEFIKLCIALEEKGEQMMNLYYFEEDSKDCVMAECVFDSASGTILEILNDAPSLYIPTQIDGVKVRDYAPYILDGKTNVECIMIPPTITIDAVVARNCPNLTNIDYYGDFFTTRSHVAVDCSKLDYTYAFEEESTISHIVSRSYEGEILRSEEINPGKSFGVLSKAFIGTGNNRYEWDRSFTRAQATTVILRLMNLDEAASAYKDKPCPFSDVPEWARGYVNLAYEKGIVRGLNETTFGADNICSAQDFLTMLFRLSELREGVEYSWSNALEDYRTHAVRLEEYIDAVRVNPEHFPSYVYAFDFGIEAADFLAKNYHGAPFTREKAARCIYVMMNIIAGENNKSLGDILVEKYGLPDSVMYHGYVRRTGEEYGYADPALLKYISDTEEYLQALRKRMPSSPGEKVSALALEITKGKNTGYEKAEAICTWVATHIFYNYDMLEGREAGTTNPVKILETRTTVCAGYAALTEELFTACGLECYTQKSDSHAWNVAYIDGRLMFIDTTWMSKLKYDDKQYHNADGTVVDNIFEPGTDEIDSRYFDSDILFFSSDRHHHLRREPAALAVVK